MILRARLAVTVVLTAVAASIGLSAATGLSAGSASAAQGAAAPIKVAMICSCSGPAGSAFSPIGDTYKAWVNTINKAGGIDGHKIDFILDDDGSNPSTALTDATNLISEGGVVSIYDNSLGDSTWLGKVQAANIPVIGQYANDPENPDVFVPGTTTEYGPLAEIALAKASHATKLGVFYCVELTTCTQGVPLLEAAVAKTTGVKVVYTVGTSLVQASYTPQCLAAEQAGVTALIPTGAPGNIEAAATDCSQQGYKPVYITSGTAWAPVMASTPGPKDDAWLSYSQFPYFVSSQPGIKALDAAMSKYYPGDLTDPNTPTGEIVNAWASGTLLKVALQNGGLTASSTPSAAMVLKGLYTLKGNTLGGLVPPLTFKKGQIHNVNCWFEAHYVNGTGHLLSGGKLSCA